MRFKVAIVGRPNVGKSSLFNRLIGYKKSVVDEVSGSTRDRLYAEATWNNKTFSLIDTGGIEFSNSSLLVSMRAQVDVALLEAHLIIFLVDVKNGVTKEDYIIASELKKTNKPVLLVVNKMDDIIFLADTFEFYKLGMGDPIGISTNHGIGIGDLLDQIVSYIRPEFEVEEKVNDEIKVAIIGKPNVGKSSLMNSILKKERTIVSDVAGTTRDSVDEVVEYKNQKYRFVDTAGIRKASQIVENNEKYSVMRALDSLERADIGILLLDYSDINILDKNVASNIQEMYKGVIICVNKWDLAPAETNQMQRFTKKIREEFKFFDYAEIVYVSAKENKRIETLFPAIDRCYENLNKEVKTSVLNDLLLDITQKNPAMIFNGGRATFSYMTQTGTKPPTFLVFCNNPEFIHFTYERYLLNEIRKNIDFTGAPIKLNFRRKE